MSEFDAIPDALKNRRQWLMWDAGADTPRRPHWDGDFHVSWNDPNDWHTYDEAVEAAQKKESWGIGYVFSSIGPYTFIDLDGGLNDRGGPKDWVPSTDEFNNETYIEVSASGTGLHIILDDYTVPDWWTDSHFSAEEHEGVEIYEEKFCVFTGDEIDTSTGEVGAVDATEWLFDAYEAINNESPTLDTAGSSTSAPSGDVDVSVYDVISRASYPAGERFGHPCHESGTGSNFLVDEDAETWRCWRHGCTGNGLHLLGIQEGVISCGEWDSNSISSDQWSQIFDAARDRGLDVPEKQTRESPTSSAKEAVEGRTDGGTTTDEESGPSHTLSLRERVAAEVLTPVDPPEEYEGEEITGETAIDRFATILCMEYDFVRPRADTPGWRDTLYNYVGEDGIYEPHGEAFIKRESERLLGAWTSNQKVREIVSKVERRAMTTGDDLSTDPNRIVVENGILDLHTGDLDAYTPGEYHQTRIDVVYDPDATCPRIEEFLGEIVEPRDVDTLFRFIAHGLYKEYAEEKVAMLLGDGQNGKSVFLSLVRQFLGEHNVSGRSLQDIGENDFALQDLHGKLANINNDMSSDDVNDLSAFKMATGRDTVTADVKYEQPIKFENHATMMFAANRMPVLGEDTRAVWRRWVPINFPYTFDDNDPGAKDATPKRVLMRELTSEEEFKGLLARCVEEISQWWGGREWFPNAMRPDDVRKQMKRAAEPVYDFAATCLEVADEDDYISKKEARDCYRKYAREEGLPTKSDNTFGENLLNLRDYPIESGQRRVEGQRVTTYNGVTWSSRGREVLGLDSPEDDEQTGVEQFTKTVVDAVNDLDSGDGVTEAMLKGRLSSQMTKMQAENAIEFCQEQGKITETPNGRFEG